MPDDISSVQPNRVQARTVSVAEAAEILGISRTTAYECVRAGTIPALRLGKRIVVPTEAIDGLLSGALGALSSPDGTQPVSQ